MCGICGVYGLRDETLVKKMLRVLHHRGPDDEGTYVDDNVSMGHARLSIIDLTEKGRQPMSNEDGNVWLVVNGEIYNFMELRKLLEKKGHQFNSNSDSESIIHAYEEYGLDFLDKLRGMFALALYDKKKKRLILARDPIGKKPLYYHIEGGNLYFTSEIKAILEAGVRKEVNPDAMVAYLAYRYTIGEDTMFTGIKRLLPGNMLVTELSKFRVQRYWNIEESVVEASDGYFIDKLRSTLEESTKLRMIADVPIGAFLSGGLDSTAVVAMARPHVSDDFHTFSLGFETFSELEYARIASQYLDTVHHEIVITADQVRDDITRIAWYYDEPLGDAAIINNYYLSREAQKYVKVVLAGEGGDELFGGYPNYRIGLKTRGIFKVPLRLRSPLNLLLSVIPGKGDISTLASKLHKYALYFTYPTLEEAHAYIRRLMSDAEIKYLMAQNPPDVDSFVVYPENIRDPLNKMLAVDCSNLLPELYLMKADKGTMANSVEERLPLLDKELIRFAFSVPSNLKIRHGQEKYILRQAVRDLLPASLLNRPKFGFGTPVGYWLKQMQDLIFTTLNESELINGYFRKDSIQALLGNFDRALRYRPGAVWALFTLALWYQVYFREAR